MDNKKKYEILNSLPPYGPMYISVTETGEKYYSEGFVVKFFKSDNSEWVANFKPGLTQCNAVFDFPDSDKIIVIAGGQGYVINPSSEKPLDTFGASIDNVIKINDSKIVMTDGIYVRIFDSSGELWCSPRVSWDGIKELKFKENLITGLAYNPTDKNEDWYPFSIDIETKDINGGSWKDWTTDKGQSTEKTKWWKVW